MHNSDNVLVSDVGVDLHVNSLSGLSASSLSAGQQQQQQQSHSQLSTIPIQSSIERGINLGDSVMGHSTGGHTGSISAALTTTNPTIVNNNTICNSGNSNNSNTNNNHNQNQNHINATANTNLPIVNNSININISNNTNNNSNSTTTTNSINNNNNNNNNINNTNNNNSNNSNSNNINTNTNDSTNSNTNIINSSNTSHSHTINNNSDASNVVHGNALSTGSCGSRTGDCVSSSTGNATDGGHRDLPSGSGTNSINGTAHNSNNNTQIGSISTTPNTAGTNGPAKECAGCGKRITERYLLKALDLYWHEDCLKCGCCDCRLGEVGSTLYTKANLILCKRDYLRLFGTTGYCAACNKVIPAFEMVMRAKTNVYHLECFACQQCNHRFCVGDRFYLCDNKILCEYDYEERLVFANMAYNPSSLAHIRRQVSNLQPAGENLVSVGGGRVPTTSRSQFLAGKPGLQQGQQHPQSGAQHQPQLQQEQSQQLHQNSQQQQTQLQQPQQLLQQHPQPHHHPATNAGPQRDDGSSGYGSPDSETFEAPSSQ